MKNLNLIKNKLKDIFSFLKKKKKKDENLIRIKYSLRSYFEENDFNYQILELHYIDVKTSKKEIVVEITLGRPGLLIGKAGRTIDEITKKLSDWLEKPVRIEIIEFNVWN